MPPTINRWLAFKAGWAAAKYHSEPGCGPGAPPRNVDEAYTRWINTCTEGHGIRVKGCSACKEME